MNKVIRESHELIKKSGLPYAVCGGFALEMFTNTSHRKHTDFDICIFREHRQDIYDFMSNQGWNTYYHVYEPDIGID